MGWERKWLVDFNAGKLFLLTGAMDVKKDGSFLEVKSSYKMLGLLRCSLF